MFQYPDEAGETRRAFLADLREDEVERLLSFAQVRRFGAGETTAAADPLEGALHIVTHGSFEIHPVPQGPTSVVRSGDLFGELAFLDARSAADSAAALEPAETVVMTRAGFDRLRLTEPRLAVLLLQDLGRLLSLRLRERERTGGQG